MTNEQKNTFRIWFYRGSFLLLLVVFFTVRAMTHDRLDVHAAKVVRTELVNQIPTNGRVEPETNYELHAPLSTVVKAIYVHVGDHVIAGQKLMQLDDLEAREHVATAESAVKAAQVALDAVTHNGSLQERQAASAELTRARIERNQAHAAVDALKRLQSSGAASAGEVGAARQRLDTAEAALSALEESSRNHYSAAEVDKAKASVKEAEAALTTARSVLAKTELRAPADGTIYALNCAASEFVEPGKVLLQIADLRHVRVRAYFDEPEIGHLAVGQNISIKWEARPGKLWNGVISQVPVSVITYGARNVGEVLVAIRDADGTLLPDTNVNVTVTTSSEQKILAVPREALYSMAGQYYVYKVVNNSLVKAPVNVGTSTLTQVAILSGLNEGDMVSTGTAKGTPLQEGASVRVVQ